MWACVRACVRKREIEGKRKKRKDWVRERETEGVCVCMSVCVDGCPTKKN